MHTCIHTYTHTHIHTLSYIRACIRTHTYIKKSTKTNTYTRICTCISMHVYVCAEYVGELTYVYNGPHAAPRLTALSPITAPFRTRARPMTPVAPANVSRYCQDHMFRGLRRPCVGLVRACARTVTFKSKVSFVGGLTSRINDIGACAELAPPLRVAYVRNNFVDLFTMRFRFYKTTNKVCRMALT